MRLSQKTAAFTLCSKIILLTLTLWTTDSHARQSLTCVYDGLSSTFALAKNRGEENQNRARLYLAGVENCNHSYSYLSETSVNGNHATSLITVVHNVVKSGNSYIIEASGSSSASAFVAAPPESVGESSRADARASGTNAIYFETFDGPVNYSFTGRSYGWGSYLGEGIMFYPSEFEAGWFVGEKSGNHSNGPVHDPEVGNEFSITGTTQPYPYPVPHIRMAIHDLTAAAVDVEVDRSGVSYPASDVAEGANWSYRLVITPVPEPATQLMLLLGGMGVIAWSRKRKASLINIGWLGLMAYHKAV